MTVLTPPRTRPPTSQPLHHLPPYVPRHTGWPIIGWARTPVTPVGGALAHCTVQALAAPLVQHLLAQANLPASAVDALVLGNALAANGNPARIVALAAELPHTARALTVDSQCCSGLDAVMQACGLLALGQADIVIAGGAEAWSRAPIRMHRPTHPSQAPQPYERPAFTPWPQRDPDLLDAAAHTAARLGLTRTAQDAWAITSHTRALAHAHHRPEVVAIPTTDTTPGTCCAHSATTAHTPHDCDHYHSHDRDTWPRPLTPRHVARMPAIRRSPACHSTCQGTCGDRPITAHSCNHGVSHATTPASADCSLSPVAISPKADGAALLLLASPLACRRWKLHPRAAWIDGISTGGDPTDPMLCAAQAARQLLHRHALSAQELCAVELHDAFAAQALAFAQELHLPPDRLNPRGGGLALGHPIGASGAIALVRALAHWEQCQATSPATPPTPALACIAAAGGLGSAALVGAWQ